jgi:hypothetical protein
VSKSGPSRLPRYMPSLIALPTAPLS